MNDGQWLKTVNAAMDRFHAHFHYMPNYPNDIDFDAVAYADVLDKCIKDDVDYTIKKYGTPAERLLQKRKDGEKIID